jgi:hypothetical protein
VQKGEKFVRVVPRDVGVSQVAILWDHSIILAILRVSKPQ